MKIIRPNSIKDGERIIIYDISISYNNYVMLIYNPGYLTEEEFSKISVWQKSDGQLIMTEMCDKILVTHPSLTGELVGIAFFPHISDNVNIQFQNKNYQFVCTKDESPSQGLVASTLIHSQHYYLLQPWIEYNLSLGVDNFIFYINNPISEDLINLLQKYDSCITLVEWNFTYYSINNFHGAQPQSLNHCLYTFNLDNVLFMDLDEFIWLNSKYSSLKDLIAEHNQIDAIFFACKWTRANTNSTDPNIILRTEVTKNKSLPTFETIRVKNIIINRDNVKGQLVHGAYAQSRMLLDVSESHFRHYMDLNSRQNRKEHSDYLYRICIIDPEIDVPLIRN